MLCHSIKCYRLQGEKITFCHMPYIEEMFCGWHVFSDPFVDLNMSISHKNVDVQIMERNDACDTPDQPLKFHMGRTFHFIALHTIQTFLGSRIIVSFQFIIFRHFKMYIELKK